MTDSYWNKIIPVNIPSQNNHIVFKRGLTFTAYYNNSVLRDQYKYCQSWNGFTVYDANLKANTWILTTNFYNEEAANIWKNNCMGWTNTNCNLEVENNQIINNPTIKNIFDYTKTTIKDWKYTFWIIPYAPTYDGNATDWRQYAIDWAFSIWEISVKLSDKTSDDVLKTNVDNFQFKPRFVTNITWSLARDWFVVWARQDSDLIVNKNLTATDPENIYLEYWYFDESSTDVYKKYKAYNKSWTTLNLSFKLSETWIFNPKVSWYQDPSGQINKTVLWTKQTTKLYTNLTQVWTLSKDV